MHPLPSDFQGESIPHTRRLSSQLPIVRRLYQFQQRFDGACHSKSYDGSAPSAEWVRYVTARRKRVSFAFANEKAIESTDTR
jgi:hypothetical protein